MGEEQAKKAFICHSSEDKDRFVTEFARRLRQNGVDAKLDEWVIKPGDSLPAEILGSTTKEGAISEADVFIAVLTGNSLESNWVEEEIERALIQKINNNTKLIPIVLDLEADQVPDCFENLYWQRISDTDDYEDEFKQILHGIEGTTDAPPVGESPIKPSRNQAFAGLSDLDADIFATVYDRIHKKETRASSGFAKFGSEAIKTLKDSTGANHKLLRESLRVLENKNLVSCVSVSGNYPQIKTATIQATLSGSEKYLQNNFSDLEQKKERVASTIVNRDINSVEDLAEELSDMNFMVISFFLEQFALNDHIYLSWQLGGAESGSVSASPTLRRLIR